MRASIKDAPCRMRSALVDRGEALLRLRGPLIGLTIAAVLALTALGATRGGGGESARETSAALLRVALPLLAAMVVAGVPASELRSGAVLLWVQRPGPPVRVYLRRCVEGVALALLLGLLLWGAQTGVLAWARSGDPRFSLGELIAVPLLVGLGGSLTWAVSCTGARGDAAGALLLLVGWMVAGVSLPMRGEGALRVVAWLVRGSAPPLNGVSALLAWAHLGGPFPLSSLLHWSAWFAGVIGVGTLLLALRLRHPLPATPPR
jgi:hypothetical protein